MVALFNMKEASVTPLVAGLERPERLVRDHALGVLSAMADTARPAVPAIARRLAVDTEPTVRITAAKILVVLVQRITSGTSLREPASAALPAASGDPHATVRAWVAFSLKVASACR